ncbi:MAG TPA: hypothetical protein VLT47_03440 [Anaeromyxobacteraceae bacterium]|nr:hypothetical protein [Anaeromyxobacteraceae bacterium]
MLALALALALGAADPCVGTDELGRSFRTCFAAGRGLELSLGGALGEGPGDRAAGADLSTGLALRWRSDTRTPSGRPEWMRDMAFLEARARFHGSLDDPRTAEGTLWSGLFLRHLAEPFLLIPGPRPIRLPFPFDVGMAIDAGSVRWASAKTGPETLEVDAVRGALLLDVSRHAGASVRRAAFGPEVTWSVRFRDGVRPVQAIAPFSAGRLELRVESADGLGALSFTGRAGWLLRFPAGNGAFYDARLGAERVLVAVNDVPLALYAEAVARGGKLDAGLEGTVGVRVGWLR